MTDLDYTQLSSDAETPQTALVSVVIATHHRPELLRQAIAGVMEQDYSGPIECIVVFDKTEPDQTLCVDESNRQVRVVRNVRSPGLAGARNSGILECSGDYVAFCDDDDRWMPAKIRVQVGLLAQGSALTAVSGIVIDYGKHSTVRVPQPGDLTLRHLVRRRVMEAHPSSVIVKRDAIIGPIGLIDEDIPGSYGEDFDWILRAVQAGTIAVAEQPLVRVKWGGSQFSQRWEIIVDAIDYVLDKHAVLSLDDKGHARLLGRRSFAEAALGRRREALRGAVQTLKLSLVERRAYLAIAVALGIVSAEQLLRWAHQRGRGI